jgi:hypothetical protein
VPVRSVRKDVFSKGVYLTLFDPSPKRSVKELYGREKELDDTVTNLEKGRWMVLLGPRRIGKDFTRVAPFLRQK